MRRALGALAAILALTACEREPPPMPVAFVTHWAKPGGSGTEFRIASSDCEARAAAVASGPLLVPGGYGAPGTDCPVHPGGMPDCGFVGAWRPAGSQVPPDPRLMVEESQYRVCMMADFWRPVSSPAEGAAVEQSRPSAGGGIDAALAYCESVVKRQRGDPDSVFNRNLNRCVAGRVHRGNAPAAAER